MVETKMNHEKELTQKIEEAKRYEHEGMDNLALWYYRNALEYYDANKPPGKSSEIEKFLEDKIIELSGASRGI